MTTTQIRRDITIMPENADGTRTVKIRHTKGCVSVTTSLEDRHIDDAIRSAGKLRLGRRQRAWLLRAILGSRDADLQTVMIEACRDWCIGDPLEPCKPEDAICEYFNAEKAWIDDDGCVAIAGPTPGRMILGRDLSLLIIWLADHYGVGTGCPPVD